MKHYNKQQCTKNVLIIFEMRENEERRGRDMNSEKMKIARLGVMQGTKVKLLKSFIIGIIKSIPVIFIIGWVLSIGMMILNTSSFKNTTDPQLKLAFISTYFGIGGMAVGLFQIAMNFLRPNYSKDIRELLLISNKLLILKESGLLKENELIDLLKRNEEIYADQKVSKKDNARLEGLIDHYDSLNKSVEDIIKQQEVRDKILK